MEGETKKGISEQNYLFCLRLFTIVKFVKSQNHPTIFENLRRILSLRLLPMQARIWPLKSSQRAVRLLGWNTEEIWTKPYHIGGKLWRGNTTNLSTRKLKKNTCAKVKTTKLVDSVVFLDDKTELGTESVMQRRDIQTNGRGNCSCVMSN